MLCSNCGIQLPTDAKVCPICDTSVTSGSQINIKDITNFAGSKAKDEYDTMK